MVITGVVDEKAVVFIGRGETFLELSADEAAEFFPSAWADGQKFIKAVIEGR